MFNIYGTLFLALENDQMVTNNSSSDLQLTIKKIPRQKNFPPLTTY